MPPARPPTSVYLAAIASGAAALIHESLWTRAFSLALGSTVEAAAATFAAFLVGLALGARLGARRSYVALELGVAVSGATVGLLLYALRDALPGLIGDPSALVRPFVAFGVALVLILVPTLLMGATFPALLALAPDRRTVARVYALSTLGGALGTLLCGFVTLRLFGLRASIGIAAALNVLAAVIAWRARASAPPSTEPIVLRGVPDDRVLVLVATFSGAAVLAFEVVWSRLGCYVIGTRAFALTTLLAWTLVLLAASASIAARLVARVHVGRLLLGVLLASPVALFVSTTLTRIWIDHHAALEAALSARGWLGIVARVVALGVLMAPTLLTLGLLFPLALVAARGLEARVAETAGRSYLWNTLGAVLGALVAGFVGLPTIGVYATTTAIAVAATIVAVASVVLDGETGRRAPFVIAIGLLVATGLTVPPPLTVREPGETLELRREDRHGIFQLMRGADGTLRAINDDLELVYHLGEPITSYVQQMQGHLGVLANPSARTALVLGSGYGITAGTLGLYPTLERIDAVELLPAMLDAAPRFHPYTFDYEANPRVHRIVDDGRHFVARSSDTYDVVSINVSDPHVPGSASLFTRDFYELLARHLAPGGVVVVHAFGSDEALVLTTLESVFGSTRLYRAYGNGVNVVASLRPLQPDTAAIRAVAQPPEVQRALIELRFPEPVDAAQIFAATVVSPRHQRRTTRVATDDRPLLELSTAGTPALLFHSNE